MAAKRKVEIVYKTLANKNDVDSEFLDVPSFFEREGMEIEADLLSIASSLFILEQYVEKDVRELKIPISQHTKIDKTKLKEVIEELAIFLIDSDIEVNLIVKDYPRSKNRSYNEFSTYKYIVPFSGGMDSFAGVLLAKQKYGDIIAVTAGHKNQGPMQSLLLRIYEEILKKNNIHWRYVSVEGHPLGIMQTRGFLYMVLAGLFAHYYNSKHIIVTECGLTMHQPKFANADLITKTTDPHLMKLVKKMLELFGVDVDFIIPFSDLTKSEIAAITPDEDFIKHTNSCLSTMWAKRSDFTHCGLCYGCVLRKLSNIVAGVEDARYASFLLRDEPGHPNLAKEGARVGDSSYNNLIHILRLAYDLLEDDRRLLYYTQERIKKYNKQQLFKRFALDVFSAIYLLKRSKVNSILEKIYEDALSNKLFTEEMLRQRIKDVRNKKYQPDFNLKV